MIPGRSDYEPKGKGGMPTNEEILARNAILDGVAMRFPYIDAGVAQQRYNRIIEALAVYSGWTDIQVRDYVKFHVIKSGKGGGAKLEAYFIGGKLTKEIDPNWLDAHLSNITELQVKFYLVQGKGSGHDALIQDCWGSSGGKFAGAFYDSKSPRGRNEPGHRSLALSRQGADVHVTVKRYRGERTHVEGHVKGKVLRQIVTDERERSEREQHRGNAKVAFHEVQYQAARRAARRFLRAIRSRGIALGEYFDGVSYISWLEPIHEKAYDLLDAEEERQAAAFGEMPGFISRDDGQATFLDAEE